MVKDAPFLNIGDEVLIKLSLPTYGKFSLKFRANEFMKGRENE